MATITLSPRPPVAGQSLTICYEGGPYPVTLGLDWRPAGTPTSVTLTAANHCQKVTVPTNATSLAVTDPTHNAEDVATVISH